VQASFGSVGDVLSAIPSVDVDPDGLVSLRGDSSVLILIDGKPSALLSGSKAGDNLRSIPARDIERIEVLPTPPPQFKADGAAGVINIILRKKRPQGFAGTVQASLGDSGRAVGGADSSFNGGPLTASLSAGFRRDTRQRTIGSDVQVASTSTTPPIDESSLLQERARRQIPTANAKVDYALDDQQSLSAAVSWLKRGGPRTYTQLNDSSTPSGALASSRRLSTGHDPETEYDGRLGYTKKFTQPGEELELSVHRSTARQREHYDYTNEFLLPEAATLYNNLNLLEDHATTEFGADYSLPLPKAQSLKLGYAFEKEDFHYANSGATVDPVTGIGTIDPAITNNFKFRQQINAAYASYQANAGDWSVLAGLRAELTHTDALLLTTNASEGDSYFQVYPSLHLNRALSDVSTLSFGASRRIRRPDPSDLDPYLDSEYTPNLRTGNANLQPQYTQSYEAGYGFEGSRMAYQLTAYYRRNRNSVTDVTEYLGDGISLTTKANLPKNNSAGFEITSNGHLFPQLGFSVSANPFYTQIDATALGETALKSTTGVNMKLKIDYQPFPTHSAQLTLTRTDKRLTPQGDVGATTLVNLGYKHQARSDLTAVLTVSDVFNGQRNERFETTPTFSGSYLRTVKGRIIYAGAIYSFGSAGSDKQFEYDQ
jgi:outer membrane receptor protein involved in Fe transport